MLLSLHGVADGRHFPDEIVQVHAPGQEPGGVPRGISVIPVQGNIVHVLVALAEHFVFPGSEGWHVVGAAAAGHQLDGRVHPFHHLRRFVGGAAVFIGVFHHVPGLVRSTGSQVDRVHDLGVGLLRPLGEFVQADLVGFRGHPGQVQPLRALVPRAYGILPVEAGNKVPAGIPVYRNSQLPHLLDHVPAESVFIRRGMAGLVDSPVDCPAKMLNKGSVNPRIDPPDGKILIQDHGCFFHGLLPPLLVISPVSQH